jgi:hypothetical protein
MRRTDCSKMITCILLMSALASQIVEADGPDTLYSGNRRIVAARFHVILYFDARHEDSGNKALILNVVQKFTEDLRKEDVPIGALPRDFEVKTTFKELSNAKALTTYLDSLSPQIESDDVVFVWLECEGTDDNLELTGGSLSRADLANRLRFGGRPRLTVFVTDACRILPGKSDEIPLVPLEGGQDNRIWRALYFGHRGLIDLRSASPGQAAFTLGDRSVFAATFRNLFFTPKIIDRIDPGTQKAQQFAEWSRFAKVFKDEFLVKSQKVTRQFINPDGSLTEAGLRLPENDVKLLKQGQTPYLLEGTFETGAR